MIKFLICLWLVVSMGLSVFPSALLAEENKAQVWHLFHSGYAVKIKTVFLLFDYLSFMHSGESLEEGYIFPEEIKEYKVYVFISHEDGDHYDPNLFNWIEDIPDITFVLGWENQKNDHCICMKPREILKTGPLEITTIESLDGGVGFLVKIDNIRIFHAGDHSLRDKTKEDHFVGELVYLKESTHSLDFMMMSIDYGNRPFVNEGTIKAIALLQPTFFFPMHCYYKLTDYQRFADENRESFSRTSILPPDKFGSLFELEVRLVDSSKEYLDFGQVDMEDSPLPVIELTMMNQGDKSIELLIQHTPIFIESIQSSIIIPPKEKTSLLIHLIPEYLKYDQKLSDYLEIWAGQKTFHLFTAVMPVKTIKNPAIQVERQVMIAFPFQKGDLTIHNTGKAVLNIQIHTGKDLKVSPQGQLRIEAGHQEVLAIEIEKNRSFVLCEPLATLKRKTSSITFDTNDPKNPIVKIQIIYWDS